MKRFLLIAALAAGALPLSGCVVATSSSSSRGGGGGGGFFLLILPFALLFVMLRIARRLRRRPGRAGNTSVAGGSGLTMLRAELSVLADDVLRLEPQVAMHADARDDYESATQRYRVAQAALDQTEAPVDLVRVQRVVDEATYAMSRVRATVDGREPPPPPPMLQQRGPGGEPAVQLDEARNPVYVGFPAPFRSGWFGLGGGLFGGLLLGSMFGTEDWNTGDDATYDDGYN
jgi:hypothetical protein